MNAKQLIVALFAVAATGAALAQTTPAAPQSGVTRAQVMAEYQQARADGSLSNLDSDYPSIPVITNGKTRAQVVAELKTAQANGQIAETDLDYPILPVTKSTLTRQQVIAEFTRARANGEIATNSIDLSYASGANPHHVSTR